MSFNEYASFDGLALGRMVRERKVTSAEAGGGGDRARGKTQR